MRVAVHITHEAARKIGGIGAVINGLCNSRAYHDFFQTTLLYGPLFTLTGDSSSHLGKKGNVLFSTRNGLDRANYTGLFRDIIEKYDVDIVYGKRDVTEQLNQDRKTTVDVILLGIHNMNQVEVINFKYRLWQDFGIRSDLYSGNWDYEQYVRIAIPLLEILERLYGSEVTYHHFAHEYMGIPSALSVVRAGKNHNTAFVAHEVSTVRFLVESHPGHDISFYNILYNSRSDKSLEDVFGSQKSNPRNALIELAPNLDSILCVSDLVRDEYLFLNPHTPSEKIRVVSNGLTLKEMTLEKKTTSRRRIVEYTNSLFNFTPDVILTHVSRLVTSKGIWRDISLLYNLDQFFDSNHLKGVYILLSTFVSTGRAPEDVLRIESEYGWPVMHSEGWPDLVGMEVETYRYLQLFNSRSKAIKGVFINQFGFSKEKCGSRVPPDTDLLDLRVASDAEIGLSVYEPFGIAQLETIPFGGTSILSSSCGSAAMLQRIFAEAEIKPFYVLDFVGAGKGMANDQLRKLTQEQRNVIERTLVSQHAKAIFDVLPVSEQRREAYLRNAQRYLDQLTWESAATAYLRPSSPT